jgi:predicted nucleic acid-binding protein
MTTRYVFDTGALIGAEKGNKRPLDYIELVNRGHAEIITPIVCVIEWWRGRSDLREKLLRSVAVQPLSLPAAKAAGVALAKVSRRVDAKLSIDAAVMAFAAFVDAAVVTSDFDDLTTLQAFFPGVRLLAI